MNNLAPIKNCPGGGVQGNLNWMPVYNLNDAVNCGYRQTYLILMDSAFTTQETIILTPLLLDERVISTGGPVDGLGPRIIKVKIYTFFQMHLL